MISSTTRVRDMAMEFPYAIRVFEELRIDYCCGGEIPIGEACAAAGIRIENLNQRLEDSRLSEQHIRASPDFGAALLSELICHIVNTHHVYTREESDRISPLVDKVLGAHGSNHPELIDVAKLVHSLFSELRPHMFKEENILFPYIVELEEWALTGGAAPHAKFGIVDNPIRMMMIEHDNAGEILRTLRSITSDYKVPGDGCTSFHSLYQRLEKLEKDLHQHIHLENNILFPRAIELERTR